MPDQIMMEEPKSVGGEITCAASQPPSLSRNAGTKPMVSCFRCRDQKLKCDRGLPCCARCQRQGADCTYPPPPDRRRISRKANQRHSRVSSALPKSIDHVQAARPRKETIVLRNKERANYQQAEGQGCTCAPTHAPSSTTDSRAADAADLPSSELGLLLLEVYFKRVYNAVLLFHKPTVFELYRENRIRGYLLRAIFAHAANFLEHTDSSHQQHIRILPIHKLFEKSWLWARSASREVLALADEPTLSRVQALQVLQLYYFSRGDIQRANVHLSLTYRLCQILGFDRPRDDVDPDLSIHSQQFEQGMSRRCFWAAWFSVRVAGRQLEPPVALSGLPCLPIPATFEAKWPLPEAELEVSQSTDAWRPDYESFSPEYRTTGRSSFSLMKTVTVLLDTWSQVKDFLAESPAMSESEKISKVGDLFQLIEPTKCSLGLPWTDLESKADSYRESPELVMSVCSVYYAISILLQASTVPILSGCTVGSSNCLPSPAGKPDMAFQQADEFSKLLGQFLATGLDITMLWPFVGYTAFVAGGVLMTLVPETNKLTGPNSQWTQAPQSVSDQVATVQTVLEVLGIYWVPLRSLALQLKEVVDHGEFRDVKPVTLPVYPWGLSCGDHSDHGQNPATIPFSRLGSSQSTHQAQNLSPISNVQVVEDPDSCRACDQPGNAHSQQEPQLQVAGTAGSSLYHPSDITYDFDMEELAANNGAGNNPIETDWWCAMPTDQIMGFSAETI